MRKFDIGGLVGFGIVGTLGFVVDGSVLTLLSRTYDVNLYVSRVASFVVAVVVTWLLNRSFVFKAGAAKTSKQREYGRYFLIQTIGALINLGIFAMLIKLFPGLHSIPILPLAAGSLCALVFNYSGARYWVFKKPAIDIA